MTTKKTNLTWNDGRLEESKKAVFILAKEPLDAEPGKFKDLRECKLTVAVVVPCGSVGFKVYDMRDDGKMVINGTRKTWDTLSEIKKHFEAEGA